MGGLRLPVFTSLCVCVCASGVMGQLVISCRLPVYLAVFGPHVVLIVHFRAPKRVMGQLVLSCRLPACLAVFVPHFCAPHVIGQLHTFGSRDYVHCKVVRYVGVSQTHLHNYSCNFWVHSLIHDY